MAALSLPADCLGHIVQCLTLKEVYTYLRVSKGMGEIVRKCVKKLVLECTISLSDLLSIWSIANMPELTGVITIEDFEEEVMLDKLRYQELTVIYIHRKVDDFGMKYPIALIRQAILDESKTLVLKDLEGNLSFTFTEGYMPHPRNLHLGPHLGNPKASKSIYDQLYEDGLIPKGIRCDVRGIDLIKKYQTHLPERIWLIGEEPSYDPYPLDIIRNELPNLVELRSDYPIGGIWEFGQYKFEHLKTIRAIVHIDPGYIGGEDKEIVLWNSLETIGITLPELPEFERRLSVRKVDAKKEARSNDPSDEGNDEDCEDDHSFDDDYDSEGEYNEDDYTLRLSFYLFVPKEIVKITKKRYEDYPGLVAVLPLIERYPQ